MKKLTLSLLGLFILLIPLLALGCEDAAPATTGGGFVTAETYNAGINALQTQINSKANQADLAAKADQSAVSTLTTRMDNFAGGTSGLTEAQVNALIDTKINALKADQAWITGSSSGGTTGGSATGTVNVITSPTNVQILGSTQLCYTAKIQNTVNQWVYVRPIITLNAASGQSPTTVTNVVISLGGSAINLTGEGNLLGGNFQFTPTLPTTSATSSVMIIPTTGGSGNGEIQIAANTTVDVLVCITITATNNIIWNVGTSVNWRSL